LECYRVRLACPQEEAGDIPFVGTIQLLIAHCCVPSVTGAPGECLIEESGPRGVDSPPDRGLFSLESRGRASKCVDSLNACRRKTALFSRETGVRRHPPTGDLLAESAPRPSSMDVKRLTLRVGTVYIAIFFTIIQVSAQSQGRSTPPTPATSVAALPTGVTVPKGYVIGADDELTLRFWGDAQMSVDVVVRPDGKISVPLLNDVQAAGLTPEQLNTALEKAASKFVAEPTATVIVREIRSRKVFVLGQVTKQGSVPLNTDMTVLQVLSVSGGLLEYADKDNIVVIRKENGRDRRFKVNFNEVVRGKNVQQDIVLQPGDTIYVN